MRGTIQNMIEKGYIWQLIMDPYPQRIKYPASKLLGMLLYYGREVHPAMLKVLK